MEFAQIDPSARVYLTACLLRREPILRQAAQKVSPELTFHPELELPFLIIWQAAISLYQREGRLLPLTAIQVEIMRQAAQNEVLATYSVRMDELVGILLMIMQTPETHLDDRYAARLLQQLIDERLVMQKLRRAQEQPDLTVEALLESFKTDVSATRIASSGGEDVFDLGNPVLDEVQQQRRPTGMRIVDALMGGGLLDGTVTGILGPTNGGKTALSLCLCVARTEMIPKDSRDVVVYYTFEQPLAEIRQRLWLAAARTVERSDIEGRRLSEFDPKVKARLAERFSPLQGRLMLYDYSLTGDSMDGAGGMMDVERSLSDLVSQGFVPRLAVVDWVGNLVRRQIGDDASRLNIGITKAIDDAKRIAGRLGVPMAMMHQLATDMGSKLPTYDFDPYCGEWCRNYLSLCHEGLVIGNPCKVSNLRKLQLVKTRSSKYGHRWFDIDSRFHQIRMHDGDYGYSGSTADGLQPIRNQNALGSVGRISGIGMTASTLTDPLGIAQLQGGASVVHA